MNVMDTNRADQERILALLEKQRYPRAGQGITAAQIHALTEALVYLVQSTPPVQAEPSVDEIYRSLLAKVEAS